MTRDAAADTAHQGRGEQVPMPDFAEVMQIMPATGWETVYTYRDSDGYVGSMCEPIVAWVVFRATNGGIAVAPLEVETDRLIPTGSWMTEEDEPVITSEIMSTAEVDRLFADPDHLFLEADNRSGGIRGGWRSVEHHQEAFDAAQAAKAADAAA